MVVLTFAMPKSSAVHVFLRAVRGSINCTCEPTTKPAALVNPGACESRYSDCGIISADTNADGSIDLVDVEPFIDLLLG